MVRGGKSNHTLATRQLTLSSAGANTVSKREGAPGHCGFRERDACRAVNRNCVFDVMTKFQL